MQHMQAFKHGQSVRTAVSPIEELKLRCSRIMQSYQLVRTAVSPIEELKLYAQALLLVVGVRQNSG